MQAMKRRSVVFLIVSFFAIFSLSIVSAEGDSNTEFSIEQLFPLMSALVIATMVWRWFIPNQLANLQVAFEIDDGKFIKLLPSTSASSSSVKPQFTSGS